MRADEYEKIKNEIFQLWTSLSNNKRNLIVDDHEVPYEISRVRICQWLAQRATTSIKRSDAGENQYVDLIINK